MREEQIYTPVVGAEDCLPVVDVPPESLELGESNPASLLRVEQADHHPIRFIKFNPNSLEIEFKKKKN